jgi:hypothetical protein
MNLRGSLPWIALALVGLAVAAGASLAASTLTSQQIGLASEPLSAGEDLAPATGGSPSNQDAERKRAQRRAADERRRQRADERRRQRAAERRKRRDGTQQPATTQPAAPPQQAAPPAAPPTVDDNSGSGSGDDSSGQGRGRGRGRGGDDADD